jgi:hypothetical protein
MTSKDTNNLWVLLYSVKQGCFHIEQMHETVSSGLRSFATKKTNDYLPVFVHPDKEECHKFRQYIAPTNATQ